VPADDSNSLTIDAKSDGHVVAARHVDGQSQVRRQVHGEAGREVAGEDVGEPLLAVIGTAGATGRFLP
jgi:hypothetical protein